MIVVFQITEHFRHLISLDPVRKVLLFTLYRQGDQVAQGYRPTEGRN